MPVYQGAKNICATHNLQWCLIDIIAERNVNNKNGINIEFNDTYCSLECG